MKAILLFFSILVIAFTNQGSWAHEGHNHDPNKLPKPPHQGRLGEAHFIKKKSKVKNFDEALKREMFFEVVVKENHIYVYPLTLTNNKFALLPLNKSFNQPALVQLHRRNRSRKPLKLVQKKDHWQAKLLLPVEAKESFISVSCLFEKEYWNAFVQL